MACFQTTRQPQIIAEKLIVVPLFDNFLRDGMNYSQLFFIEYILFSKCGFFELFLLLYFDVLYIILCVNSSFRRCNS